MAFAGLLAVFLVATPGLSQVSAVEVHTPQEITVRNGAKATLRCTFSSREIISSATSVSWSFQAEGARSTVSFFYYSNWRGYPGKDVQFEDRVRWAGNLNRKDASINIANIQFSDNGIYVCDVKNPPDIIVIPGKIRLRVVGTVKSLNNHLDGFESKLDEVRRTFISCNQKTTAVEE